MTDEALEQRVQTVADRLRANPKFMALLLDNICPNKVRVAGTWVKDTTTTGKEAHKLPNLSREGHNISIIFLQDGRTHPFKWIVYSPSGSPVKLGREETLEEAKGRAEEEAVKLGIILTDQIEENPEYTTSKWVPQGAIRGQRQYCRVTGPSHNAMAIAVIVEMHDGTWVPSVQGLKDDPFKPFYLLEDAMKAVDNILVAMGHVLPPEEP